MQTRLGPLTAELTEAERAKFTAPMVLVHGLWDESRSWRRFTGFLRHRGWRCIVVGWPEDGDRRSLAACEHALGRALDQLGEPAVLVGHDLGGLLALRMAARTRAAVALAPLIPHAATVLQGAGSWLERRRGVSLSPGRSLRDAYPVARRNEPASLLAEIATGGAGEPETNRGLAPRLVLAGSTDAIVPPNAARDFAAAGGNDIEVVAGGHALHLDDGWEDRAAIMHRWLIRNLGEELLALYEEAWADRDP